MCVRACACVGAWTDIKTCDPWPFVSIYNFIKAGSLATVLYKSKRRDCPLSRTSKHFRIWFELD